MNSSRPVEAIVFDVDGTLYDPRRMRWAFVPTLVRRLSRAPAATLSALRIVRTYREVHEAMRGEQHRDLGLAQCERTAERLGMALEDVRAVIADWFERAPLAAVARAAAPGLAGDFARLRANGTRIAVLSDYPPIPKLEALGIAHFVERVSWSQLPEIGVLKPDPTGLLHALKGLEVAPERALYVGDRPELDEVAARAAGCGAVIVGGRAPLRPQTRSFADLGRFADWFLAQGR